MIDCFINLPKETRIENPLDIEWIQTHQANIHNLVASLLQQLHEFPIKDISGRLMICKRISFNDQPQDWKICIPS